jgi:hypothetical protein
VLRHLGAGERLFGKTGNTNPMRLGRVWALGENLVLLTYEIA